MTYEVPTNLVPGQLLWILGDYQDALQARNSGLHLRDTILIIGPNKVQTAFLFRKPPEGTLAQNALKYGTGVLNIDGCRVRSAGHRVTVLKDPDKGTQKEEYVYQGGWKDAYISGTGRKYTSEGRWPPNLLLVHTDNCCNTGISKIKGDPRQGGGVRPGGFYDTSSGKGSTQPCSPGHADENGLETVDTWECSQGCLLSTLDAHTSRFFPQFANLHGAYGWLAKLTTPPHGARYAENQS